VPETSLTKICIVSASEEMLEMLEMLEERRMVAIAMCGLVERERVKVSGVGVEW
jgi:hypothetical protein